MKLILAFILTAIFTFNAAAQLNLPSVISDNMVLQRDIKIPVWGWADPNMKVTVKFMGQTKSVITDLDGCWKLYLNPVSANHNPQKMSIECGTDIITLTNILVGEVWLCSGQSNMQFPLLELKNPQEKIAKVNDSEIRFVQVNRINFKPYECDDCLANWQECSPKTVGGLTAVGYYFAQELREKLGVPVGLIEADFGGTRIEAWTDADTLLKWPDYRDELSRLARYKNNKRFSVMKEREKMKWFEELKKVDKGFAESWMMPDIDDSKWKKIENPCAWVNSDLKGFMGTVWYRKKINIPKNWKNKNLVVKLGVIRDYEISWMNGKGIGMFHIPLAGWWSRNYVIKKNDFETGENTVVVCDYRFSDVGGMLGPASNMSIFPENEPEKAISLAGEWLYAKGYAGDASPQIPASLSLGPNTFSILYNSMIAPLIPYAIRGTIWYQGESNRYNSDRYREMFSDMIKSWRNEWNQGEFPFYYVQIAPFNYNDGLYSALLQEAQSMTLKLTNTGMAVTMDIAELNDIHPKNKKDVGHRLALWALAKDYGFTNIVYSGPLYKKMKIEGNKIILSFDYSDGLKTRDGKPLTYFEIAGNNKKFIPANAKIENNEIIVSSGKVEKPVAVRYGWNDTAESNLCNGEGLPASPFRTDDWK